MSARESRRVVLTLSLALSAGSSLGACLVGRTEFREAGAGGDAAPDADAGGVFDAGDVSSGEPDVSATDVEDGGLDADDAQTVSDAEDVVDAEDVADAVDVGVDAGPLRVLQVAAGWYGTCAVLSDGRVFCWGQNSAGQLGPGGVVGHTPTEVTGIRARAIAMGSVHTCAILSGSNAVWCWGDNSAGQLGDGGATGGGVPRAVSGLDGVNVVGIVAGVRHTCAWSDTGRAWCWGANDVGQLGNGTTSADPNPLPVALTTDGTTPVDQVTDMAAGSGHTCAVRLGAVVCWGQNGAGQLGIVGTNPQYFPTRGAVGVSNAVEVVAGSQHTCARLATNRVDCWGLNTSGQVGAGDLNPHDQPTNADGTNTYRALEANGTSTCGVRTDGTTACWGGNGDGQLGSDGGNNSDVALVVPAGADAGALIADAVAVGLTHACALTTVVGATPVCWGSNRQGELGNSAAGVTRQPPGLVDTFF